MEFDQEIIEETRAARNVRSSVVQRHVGELILARPHEEVIGLLIKRSEGPTPWQAVLDYARALSYGLGSLAKEDESSRAAKLLQSTFVHIVKLIHVKGSSTADKWLGDCVSFLLQKVENFPKSLLPAISEAILSVSKSGEEQQNGVQSDEGCVHSLLEVLARSLNLVGSAGSVSVIGEDGEELQTSGMQYRASALARLLAIRWSKKIVTTMASLLRDLALDSREMDEFLRKLFVHMKDSEPQDLPSLVYQLLLLASKGYKRIILTGMINFFNKKHAQENTHKGKTSRGDASSLKSTEDAFRQIEGTVVLHINFSVKQDPALGQEFLYLVRTNSWPLTPFLVSVLLSIGRIQRFEQPAFELLRNAAVKCFRDCQQCRDSRWAAAILSTACSQIALNVEDSFMRTVQRNSFGWDHIIPSVVRVGFILIESAGPGRPKVVDLVRPSGVSDTQELGIRLLSAAYDVHEMARDEIIEQCKCRIIGLKPQHSAPILRLIVLLVQNCPQLILEHSSRLKECLDYFTFLHPSSASSLMQAISPLFQMSRDLQDYTILVLRKAMFGREETARMTAVQGLFNLVVSEKRLRASDSVSYRDRFSEASCSQSSSQIDRSSGRPGNLLQDLLGLLRRCLSQQVGVREKLYQGLPKLLEVDPAASEIVFDLVLPQLNRYYLTEQEQAVSLNLDLCVVINNAEVRLVEPLDHLVSCVHQMLLLQPQSGASPARLGSRLSESENHLQEVGSVSSGEALAIAFKRLRKSMNKSFLGEFYRDKTLDLSLEGCEGGKNMELARILLGVLEVLIDSAVLDCINQDSELRHTNADKELLSFLDLHDSLMEKVNHKQGRSTGKGLEKEGTVKKGPGRAPKAARGPGKGSEPKNQGGHLLSKSATNSVFRALLDKRKSFLSSSSMVYLLNSYTKHLQSKCELGGRVRSDQETAGPAQGTSQQETAQESETRAAGYAFQNCLRHLKAMSNEDVGEIDSFERADTSWQLLIQPLLSNLVALRDSVIDAAEGPYAPNETGTVAKRKKADKVKKCDKGKNVDTEMGEGLMMLSLKCLEELIRVASQRRCIIEVLKYIDVDPSNLPDDQGPENDGELLGPEESKENVFEAGEARRLHSWLLTQARPLLEGLLFRAFYSEVEVLCGIIQTLACKQPRILMQKHGTWAHSACKGHNIRNVAAARSLMNMAICLSTPPDDLALVETFAAELLKVTGSEEHQPTDRSDLYPMINKVTRAAIGGLLLQKVESVLVDLEWLEAKLKMQAASTTPQLDRKTPSRPGGSQRALMEDTLHNRMEAVISVLSTFAAMTLNGTAPKFNSVEKSIISGGLAEQVFRATTHFYRCLASATRLLIAPKGFTQAPPSTLFQRIADLTCKRLTASIYVFVSSKERDMQAGSGQGKESVSQIKRESRTVPNLIFHIEECERYLLQLTKVTNVNLLRFAKRSTTRDFKITEGGKKRKTAPAEDAEQDEEDPDPDPEEEEEGTPLVEDEEEDEQEGHEEQSVGAPSNGAGEGDCNNSKPSRSSGSRSRMVVDSDSEDDEAEGLERKKEDLAEGSQSF